MARTLQDAVLGTAEELAGLGCWTVEISTKAVQWSDGMYRVLGLDRDRDPPSAELLVRHVHPADRMRVKEKLHTAFSDPAEFVGGTSLEYRIVRPDGAIREISGRGRAHREETGWRWFGVEQDVTDQRMTERELLAHHHVAQALREWESFDEGVVVLLRRMATALDFPTAAIWMWDGEADELVCRAVWSRPDTDATEWEAATRSLRFRPGEGLPGKAWTTLEAVLSADVATDPDFRNPEVAAAMGIESALLIPAIDDAKPIAVLAFYSSDRRGYGERLLRTLTGIGAALGPFLSRRRVQLAPTPLSPREVEVLGLAAEGLSGPQIAERLVLSPSTIKTHFENIYEKLGVGDRAGAVAYALRIGLIT